MNGQEVDEGAENSQRAQSPEPDSCTWISWSQHSVPTWISSLDGWLKKIGKRKKKKGGPDIQKKNPPETVSSFQPGPVSAAAAALPPATGQADGRRALWCIDGQLQSPHLFSWARLPPLQTGELDYWWQRRRTGQPGGVSARTRGRLGTCTRDSQCVAALWAGGHQRWRLYVWASDTACFGSCLISLGTLWLCCCCCCRQRRRRLLGRSVP